MLYFLTQIQGLFALVIFLIDSHFCQGLASNSDPFDPHLPSSWDYWHEPPLSPQNKKYKNVFKMCLTYFIYIYIYVYLYVYVCEYIYVYLDK
jgi:hypothetical protein